MKALRTLFRLWAIVVFAAVLVQVGAAGYGAFYAADKSDPGPLSSKSFDHGFSFHKDFGYTVLIGAVILFLLALGARIGRQRVFHSLSVPVLVAIAVVLGSVGGNHHPVVGIFHPIVALLVFGASGALAAQALRDRAA